MNLYKSKDVPWLFDLFMFLCHLLFGYSLRNYDCVIPD